MKLSTGCFHYSSDNLACLPMVLTPRKKHRLWFTVTTAVFGFLFKPFEIRVIFLIYSFLRRARHCKIFAWMGKQTFVQRWTLACKKSNRIISDYFFLVQPFSRVQILFFLALLNFHVDFYLTNGAV